MPTTTERAAAFSRAKETILDAQLSREAAEAIRAGLDAQGLCDETLWSKFLARHKFPPNGAPPAEREPGADDEAQSGAVFSDPNAAMQGVEWLWRGRVARGKPNGIEGEGGVGKTSIIIDFVSRLSRGEAPYDGDKPAEALTSIIVSAEDAWHDTLKPRLVAAGAELARVFHLVGFRNETDIPTMLDLERDTARLEAAIIEKKAAAVAWDPLDAFLGRLDPNSNTDVRRKLGPIAAMLERTNTAGIANRHHGKAAGTRAKYRGLHSVAFTNAARVVLTAGEHPTDRGVFALAWAKGNLAERCPTLLYKLVEVDLGFDKRGLPIRPVRVEWLGTSDLTADDITGGDAETQSKIDAAAEFLTNKLSQSEQEGEWLKAEAKKLEISYATLRRAKKALGIKSRPGGFGGAILWYPPEARS